MAAPKRMKYPDACYYVIDETRIGELVFKNKIINGRKTNRHIEKLKEDLKVSQEQTPYKAAS